MKKKITLEIDKKTIVSLTEILDYLWPDEEAHWIEMNKPKEHIYHDLDRVSKCLYRNKIL